MEKEERMEYEWIGSDGGRLIWNMWTERVRRNKRRRRNKMSLQRGRRERRKKTREKINKTKMRER